MTPVAAIANLSVGQSLIHYAWLQVITHGSGVSVNPSGFSHKTKKLRFFILSLGCPLFSLSLLDLSLYTSRADGYLSDGLRLLCQPAIRTRMPLRLSKSLIAFN